jgi:exodeoxyribonuclease V alpha subunit
LESDPDRFLSVKGIGPSAVGMLVEEWKTKRTMHEACSFLHSVGIGPAIAERLAACLGGTADLCAEAVRKNPYAVVGQSKNLLTFPLADEIALTHLQLSREDERRVREGLVFTVSRLAWQGGHTCVVASEAVNATVKLLKLSSKGAVVSALAAESAGGRLPSSENGQIVSPRALFNAEDSIASDLKRIIEGTHPLPYVNVENCVRMAEKSFGGEGKSYRLAAAQAEAVRQAMKCKVLVVTGGPGVGKTTAMASIVSAFRRMKIETVVASPTGRAAAKVPSFFCFFCFFLFMFFLKSLHKSLNKKQLLFIAC